MVQDLKHSVRQLVRQPVFALTAVVTLAIGMGVNAVAFTLVNGMLFKGSAASAVENVGRIATSPRDDPERYASLAEYERFDAALRGSAITAAEGRSTVAWQHDGVTSTAWVLFVSSEYFSMVRPQLLYGSLRVERRSVDAPVVLIGERFWRDQLRSPSLAGLTLRFNNIDVVVSGVMAESFTGPAGLYSPDVWLPLDDLAAFRTAAQLQRRDTRWLFVMAKPQSGANAATIQGHLDTTVNEMAREWPDTHHGHPVAFFPIGEANGERSAVMVAAAIGMGIIGLVLVLACFNVANLLLARAVERERDMGIRTALGAEPSRLIKLVVTEGLLIAIAAGALSLLLASWTQALLGTFAIPIEQPQHIDLAPDGSVVLFVTLLIGISGVLPGVWPALSAARVDVVHVLGSQGTSPAGARPAPLRRWLVSVQVAGSTMFLAIAGLFVQAYGGLLDLELGFDRAHLAVVQVDPAQHGLSRERAQRYVTALNDRIRAIAGVTHTAIAQRAPFFIGYDNLQAVWPDQAPCDGACPKWPVYPVAAGYFSAMGIDLVEGRSFAAGLWPNEIIVNGEFARAQWPDGRALGRVVRIGDDGFPMTVVGVTAPTRMRGLDRQRPSFFVPIAPEHFDTALTVVARTAGDPAMIVRPIVEAASLVDPDVPVLSVKTMDQQMAVQMWPYRTLSWMFGVCGILAVVLAVVGLGGIVIHSVNRRGREFGVRLAVGAARRDVVHQVLASGLRMLIPGLIAGMLLAVAAAHLTRSVLVGVSVLNPMTYIAVAALHAAIVLIACIGPAWRAARVDPVVMLRQ